MQKRIRLSYTMLNLWKQGRYEDAVIFYFKLGPSTFDSKALQEGRQWDQTVQDSVKKDQTLPPEYGNLKLKDAKVQVKLEGKHGSFDLVGVLDILDGDTVYEIKSGVKSSAQYSNDFQVPMYFYLCNLNNITVSKGYIIRYNQYKKEFDKSLIWNTKQEIDRVVNLIDTFGPEIEQYFRTENLLDKYQNKV